jgi:hypothetical protein
VYIKWFNKEHLKSIYIYNTYFISDAAEIKINRKLKR